MFKEVPKWLSEKHNQFVKLCNKMYVLGANKMYVLGANNSLLHVPLLTNKRKNSKAIPVQPWTGPEGSRRLRLPDFKTIGT
jgi:hypothetical protein